MPISIYFFFAVLAYLLGSIPFGYILVRLFLGADVRRTGSGNIGATNVARTGSKGLAIATLALDILKGYVAVTIAYAYGMLFTCCTQRGDEPDSVALRDAATVQQVFLLAAVSALCAIIGHIFTVWLRFKGGKGVATGLGVFLALAPKAVLIVLAVFVAIVAVTRYISLGSDGGRGFVSTLLLSSAACARHARSARHALRRLAADHLSPSSEHQPAAGRHRKPLRGKARRAE